MAENDNLRPVSEHTAELGGLVSALPFDVTDERTELVMEIVGDALRAGVESIPDPIAAWLRDRDPLNWGLRASLSWAQERLRDGQPHEWTNARSRAESILVATRFVLGSDLDSLSSYHALLRATRKFEGHIECDAPGCWDGELSDGHCCRTYEREDGTLEECSQCAYDGWPCPECAGTGFADLGPAWGPHGNAWQQPPTDPTPTTEDAA